MGGLSLSHLLIFLVIALLVFGAGRVSEIGKGLGEGIKNFKKGLREDEEDDDARIAVKRKAIATSDEAPRLETKKKKVIQIEVDDDEDEAEVLRKVAKAKQKPTDDPS